MIKFSEWYFSWGWLVIGVAGFGMGMWTSHRREWTALALWLVWTLTLGFGAIALKLHWIT